MTLIPLGTSRACLLTCHGKVVAVAPALTDVHTVIETVDSFDTDQLGTFSGEVERSGSMRDAALAKAKLACRLGGSRFGLGSEGSFGADPYLGVSGWGTEILLWWDAEEGYAVEGFAQGPETNWRTMEAHSIDAALTFAREVGFPGHGLIIGRPSEIWFSKDCPDEKALATRVAAALPGGPVRLQTDMRAHRNPTRMRMISRATVALAERLSRYCPACGAPGYGPCGVVPGAPCEACDTPTALAQAEIWRCPRCTDETRRPLHRRATPAQCDRCNP